MSRKSAKLFEVVKGLVGEQTLSPKELLTMLHGVGENVSRPTLNRLLAVELSTGNLEVVGNGPTRAYRLKSDKVADWFAIHHKNRPVVPYRRQIIDQYIPNQTSWLGQDRIKKLHDSQQSEGDISTYAREISRRLIVDLAYASSAMEGNTYSWADTRFLLEDGIVAVGKSDEEMIMVINHKEAVNLIVGLFDRDNLYPFAGVDKRLLREVHALLSDHLVQDSQRGVVRQQIVGVGGSAYVPESAPQILDEDLAKICQKANAINDPFERSFFLLVTISYLQPFIDVNKRTGRLLSAVPLLQAGLAPLSFMRVNNNQYKQGLIEFYELQSTIKIADVYLEAALDSAIRYKTINGLSAEQKHLFVNNRVAIRSMIEQFGRIWNQGGQLSIDDIVVPATPDGSLASDLREFVRSYVAAFSPELAKIDRYSPQEIAGLSLAHDYLCDLNLNKKDNEKSHPKL